MRGAGRGIERPRRAEEDVLRVWPYAGWRRKRGCNRAEKGEEDDDGERDPRTHVENLRRHSVRPSHLPEQVQVAAADGQHLFAPLQVDLGVLLVGYFVYSPAPDVPQLSGTLTKGHRVSPSRLRVSPSLMG